MGESLKWPSWLKRDTPRQTALNVLNRYWGMGAMQRQRALIPQPLLPDGEDETEDEVAGQ